jgi:hypothetical protein
MKRRFSWWNQVKFQNFIVWSFGIPKDKRSGYNRGEKLKQGEGDTWKEKQA